MAITDILPQPGDTQDFVLEMTTGNGTYLPNDILLGNPGGSSGAFLCAEVPAASNSGGNIFIMSE